MKPQNENCFSIIGDVEIVDNHTNKVLVHKHNMVVNTGRKYIMDIFLNSNKNNLSAISSGSHGLEGYALSFIEFGGYLAENEGGVTPSVAISDSGLNNALSDYKFIIGKDGESGCSVSLNGSKGITFTITKSGAVKSKPVLLTELGIFLQKDNADDKLFSRITFDPIYFDSDSAITLNYTIYFGIAEEE